jgi:hypothetical protein
MDVGSKVEVIFFSIYFIVQQFPEVNAALWYRGTRVQKYEMEKYVSIAKEE